MRKTKKMFLIIITVIALIGVLSACNNETEYDFKDGTFGYKINEDGETVTLTNWIDTTNGNITIPATVTNGGKTYDVTGIGNGAFAATPVKLTAKDVFGKYPEVSNDKLLSVTFGEGSKIKKIEGRAFEKCKKLTIITLPETVETIEGFAFYKCTSLNTITIDKNVKSIGDDCFSGCSSLSNVTLQHTDKNNLPEIGDRAFKWYDESVTSFMGSNDPYKVLTNLNIYVSNTEMLNAFKSTGNSTNINLRFWNDYASKYSVIGG